MKRTARILDGLAAAWYIGVSVAIINKFGAQGIVALVICGVLCIASLYAAVHLRVSAVVALAATIFAVGAVHSVGPLVAPAAALLWCAASMGAREGFPRVIIALGLAVVFILGARSSQAPDEPWSRFLLASFAVAVYAPPLWAIGATTGWAKQRKLGGSLRRVR